ncbi:large subunit GTPase 1 homolog [Patella vulgata]|uniref:large subunit GTPase 1 homolog n=1 Tax=Patella vulgata TaxID=6465 RepID=UPI0021802DB8|nr:large subunit GTPase 1 homolog [Patella vulgata]
MGKNNKKKTQPMLGRTIIKDRFRGKRKDGSSQQNYLHTTELNDGYDWGRLNLQSVTEQSNLEDFLTTAELAGTEFTAEKLNIKFVDPSSHIGLLSSEEKQKVDEAQKKHSSLLQIPRRPRWTDRTTPEELDTLEKEAFLQWRKQLAQLQEKEHIVMTPFEKNLDFWRQLWRVIERSDIIVQIVDGRNPLLFRCGDLEDYVSEVDKSKVNLLLVNKADYLSTKQRKAWADYFAQLGVRVAFWSALEETARQNEAEKLQKEEANNENSSGETDSEDENNITHVESLQITDEQEKNITEQNSNNMSENSIDNEEASDDINTLSCDKTCVNSSTILTGEELLDLFRSLHSGPYHTDGVLTVGMVGYPNVGKSSTINAILRTKKVPVSATPGRTKHFQTLFVEPSLMLCDCPGLVYPSFVSTKAELVVNGILPVDQMRDHLPPVNLICERIHRNVLEIIYGINIRKPVEGEDPDRRPNAYEVLNAYGAMRGYMTSRGAPDGPRSSRYIIKDYINGKLLFCHPPPGIKVEEFQEAPVIKKSSQIILPITDSTSTDKQNKKPGPKTSSLDKEFFAKMHPVSHLKGVKCIRVAGRPDLSTPHGSQQSLNLVGEKPWRRHHNKNKKEKLRRVYSQLDQHDYY